MTQNCRPIRLVEIEAAALAKYMGDISNGAVRSNIDLAARLDETDKYAKKITFLDQYFADHYHFAFDYKSAQYVPNSPRLTPIDPLNLVAACIGGILSSTGEPTPHQHLSILFNDDQKQYFITNFTDWPSKHS